MPLQIVIRPIDDLFVVRMTYRLLSTKLYKQKYLDIMFFSPRIIYFFFKPNIILLNQWWLTTVRDRVFYLENKLSVQLHNIRRNKFFHVIYDTTINFTSDLWSDPRPSINSKPTGLQPLIIYKMQRHNTNDTNTMTVFTTFFTTKPQAWI